MTNIQAIDLLKDLEQSLDDYCELNDEGKTAFRMAITALELFGISEQLPSAQPEKRTEKRTETHACDCISRQAAIDVLNAEGITKNMRAHRRILSLPSAVRRGRWKDIPFTARWICSNCDYISEFASFKYCPDCGARMDLEEDK